MIERFYVDVKDRQMHYRRSGSGVPLIVIHASPMSSVAMEPWIIAMSKYFTVISPDTPGFGQSSPLPLEQPEIEDYAKAMIDLADALGIDRFLVAGTHTGSKIALSVAVQAPGRVIQLVMDGLAVYTDAERDEQLARYTEPIEPLWHGGHLLSSWHTMRSMFIFWPWFRQEADHRLVDNVADPQAIHRMVFDQMRAVPFWGLSYRAAFRFDTHRALNHLRVPSVLLAAKADPLHGHLSRLGTDTKNLTISSIFNEDHVAQIVQLLDASATAELTPPAPSVIHRSGTSRRYVATSKGNVHVRMDGDPAATQVALLHSSPGSADSYDSLIKDLARDHLVIAPDLLGNGYSDAPEIVDTDLKYYADSLVEVLDALDLNCLVFGTHTGAGIAIELAINRPERIFGVVAEGMPSFTDEEREELLARYTPSFTPEKNGEHLVRAWHMLRDMQLFWPWYRSDADHIRSTNPSSADLLQHQFVQLLKSGETYSRAYRASFKYPAKQRLPLLQVPTLLCADPKDMLYSVTKELVPGVGNDITFQELDSANGQGAAWAIRGYLQQLIGAGK